MTADEGASWGVETTEPTTEQMGSLVGRTIIRAEWSDPGAGGFFGDHGECRLTLDDGRTVVFNSTGYDASDLWMEVVEP